jgi:hypothetical protein
MLFWIRNSAVTKPWCIVLVPVLLGCTALYAQDLPKIERTFDNGGTLRFYGQINKGVLTYDDGQESESYGLIDNDNSNTRFGLTYKQDFGDGWNYLGTVEVAYAPFSTSNTNLLQQSPPASAYEFTNANIRKIDNRVSHPDYGTFFLGQGDMASNNTAEVDLSGTTVISYSSVADSAGAQLLRQADGTLSDIEIKNAFTNYDGLSRKVRARYDTRLWSGFGLRTSYGRDLLSDNETVRNQDLFDVAAAYERASDDFKLAAQTAYSWKGSDITIVDASGSILHLPTGLSATAAAGTQDKGGVSGSYGYIKLGWQGDLIAWGTTAVSVDFYRGSDIVTAGSESNSSALAIVQNIPRYNTELWLTWREYDYSEADMAFDSASAFFVGARFKF